jgi:serine/threonine protein kinase
MRRSQTAATGELTEAGKVMGTPSYMAPEQVSNPAAVDHRADIYALGVVFYQMLTGELPGKRLEPPSSKVQIAGIGSEADLEAAQGKVEVLKAELDGDEVGVAQARLAVAQRALRLVSQLFKAGLAPFSDAEAAQTEVQIREAELRAAQAAQGGRVSAQNPGTTPTFSVTATGTNPLFYQWTFNGTNIAPSDTNVPPK